MEIFIPGSRARSRRPGEKHPLRVILRAASDRSQVRTEPPEEANKHGTTLQKWSSRYNDLSAGVKMASHVAD